MVKPIQTEEEWEEYMKEASEQMGKRLKAEALRCKLYWTGEMKEEDLSEEQKQLLKEHPGPIPTRMQSKEEKEAYRRAKIKQDMFHADYIRRELLRTGRKKMEDLSEKQKQLLRDYPEKQENLPKR